MQDSEYRQLAAVEDRMWYFRALHGLIERALAARLAGGRSAAALDAGCGTGGLIRRLRPRHPSWEWSAIDAAPLACALARERTGRNVVQGTLEALPWSSGQFDAAVCADVLYHLDDDRAALRELHRVLRPGGTLVVNVPAYPWLWSYHDVAVAGRRRYGRSELRDKLVAAGFVIQRFTPWNCALFPLIVIRRKLLPAPAEGGDVRSPSAPAELLGRTATALERGWLALAPLPWGSSFFAVARRAD